ncbi:hypothetical protein K443DRAFT_218318 [Laccaria amethystina LaAM-08-1]|uniref:Uncharacterized protein n=1 Tax=Laccaria amethystina LaAM-08-1 TaxID=1095629 RepID=A0A0C9YGL4_9AGAR|nr:hypothetical protein K443DRAFT_218318 [Laccaria amethystina LaAM-08-1]
MIPRLGQMKKEIKRNRQAPFSLLLDTSTSQRITNSSKHSCFSSVKFPNICQFNALSTPLTLSSKGRSNLTIFISILHQYSLRSLITDDLDSPRRHCMEMLCCVRESHFAA